MFVVLLLIVQVAFLVLFLSFADYSQELLPKNSTAQHDEGFIVPKYAHFQDIHVMIFIGFAFLMTFLKRYGFSATGFNLFLGALAIQWAILMRGFFAMEGGYIKLSLDSLIGADIAAATVLISMGALLGRTTPVQLLVMGLFEIALFAANEHFQLEMMRVVDAGGSIVVHAYGAYFGLAVSFVLRPKKEDLTGPNEGSSYTSDIFAMVGTIFLWIFWPSFNSALVDGPEQERAIVHTYLALAACTVTTFIVSALVNKERKFDMVHVQNSTLAGGVAVGAICNLIIQPHGAIIVGALAGFISVIGYRYLSPIILSKLHIVDTCGVHNLHGMPAILSALFSALYASMATVDTYRGSLTSIFPAMQSIDTVNGTSLGEESHMEYVIGGYGRSASKQGSFQLLAILSTVVVAIVGGLITGLLIRMPQMFGKLSSMHEHLDDLWFHMAEPLEDNIGNNKIIPFDKPVEQRHTITPMPVRPVTTMNAATLPLVIRAEMIYKKSLQTHKQSIFLRAPIMKKLEKEEMHHDQGYWEVEHDS